MSRVGRKIITVPKDVKVQIGEGSLQIQGPKGKLSTPVPPGITFALDNGSLSASRSNDERQQRAFHGLARALASNAIKGVPEGIKVAIDKQTHIVVSGIDRQRVGQVAAEIRALRKPDPYKQKGIRYMGEVLKKKAGKAGATGAK
jgi:large subunit ribosomal protein L6